MDQFKRDFPDGGLIYDIGPEKQAEWTDRNGQRHNPLRLYFVKTTELGRVGSIWIVFDHLEKEDARTQIITHTFDKSRMEIVTDGHEGASPLMLYRIALIDRNTRIGPTFVSGYPQRPYVKYEYDSHYVRSDWERAVTSSCGGGPLTAVPKSWTEERNRNCRDLSEKFELRKTWYGRLMNP